MATVTHASGRLYALLVEGLQVAPNTIIFDAWRQLFKLENPSTSELLTILAWAIRLPAEAEAEVHLLEGVDRKKLLKWVGPVHKAFSVLNLNATWDNFRGPLDSSPEGMFALDLCADLIKRQFPQPVVEPDTLADLLRQVSELRIEILDAEIGTDLKELILDHLRRIEFAIETYGIRGAAGMRDAVEQALGALVTHSPLVSKSAKAPAVNSFWRFLTGVMIVMSVTADGYTLAQAGANLFFPTSAESVVTDVPEGEGDFKAPPPDPRHDDTIQSSFAEDPLRKV